jgi:hypothetical protein
MKRGKSIKTYFTKVHELFFIFERAKSILIIISLKNKYFRFFFNFRFTVLWKIWQPLEVIGWPAPDRKSLFHQGIYLPWLFIEF